jgi:5-methylcytosine-specific restriction endonuclease McrA
MKTGNRRRSLKLSVKFPIWRSPCAVCGCDHNICVDHILPVRCGGTNDLDNLQPLCWQCNHIKGGKPMTNDDIRKVVDKRGPDFYLISEYEKAFQYTNHFDRMGFETWKRSRR